MFTGLIERIGTLKGVRRSASGAVFEIDPGPAFEISLGDSVAVDGVCLTATSITSDSFSVDVSPESLSRSSLGDAGPGAALNLERALRLGDRLGGHLVAGHVDAMGKIAEKRASGAFTSYTFTAPPEVMMLVVEKGSVAIDGISLTVNDVGRDRFGIMVIPETLSRTTLADKKAGDAVNLETDMLGKYVARLMGKGHSDDDELMKKLMEEGFI